MTTSRSNGYLALLLGVAFMVAMGGCGKTGMSASGSRSDAGIATGGSGGGDSNAVGSSSQGGSTDSTSTSGQGGATSSAGGGGQGGITSSGGTSKQGGATSFTTPIAGNGGWGGTSNTGGSKGSGGSSGGQTGTIVSPRAPTTHRVQANSCVGVFAPEEPVNPNSTGNCMKHADCTQGTNGRCITDPAGIARALRQYYCTYDRCATDADCDAGKVCFCSPSDSARCLNAGNCRTDADCGGGANSYCSPSYGADCGGYHYQVSYYCHTPKDTCIDNSDCTEKDYCDYDIVDGRWECKSPNMSCVIG